MSTLADIRTKVRRITGLPSPNQLTDAELDAYVNTFYLYDLPAHLKLINLKETFSIITEPDVQTYNFTPNTIVTVEPPVYIGGYEVQFYQSRQPFFTTYPEIQRNQVLTSGNGTAGPYGGTIIGTPVLKNQILLSTVDSAGNALSAEDDGSGSFTGDVLAGATINYMTGAVAGVTWTSNIASGEPVRIQAVNYQRARPQAVLFYNDIFTFSPVPDQAYEMVIDAYVVPMSLTNPADTPELNEWWQLLAYGAALKIFADSLDMESYQKTSVFFDEQKRLIERRTMQQIKVNRAATIYTRDVAYRTPFSSGT